MKRQKSYQEAGGKLYLVATPIGNLGDISSRALDILRTCDLIAAEDTRQTRKLLSHFQFSTPLVSYHEHNERKQLPQLISQLQQGKQIALVSDAGMPVVSDPGESLVQAALAKGIAVIPIPGANAALSALVASGLPVQPFLFVGFLPRPAGKRRSVLQSYRTLEATLIFYESPHRVEKLLMEIREELGERRAVMVRELTKKHEEWVRGTVESCWQAVQQSGARGEYTLLVEGYTPSRAETSSLDEVVEAAKRYVKAGYTRKEAIKRAAQEHQWPKKEVYQAFHQHQNSEESAPLAGDEN